MFVESSSWVRYFARLGSSISPFGRTRVGSSCSVLDSVHSEATLSLGSSDRLDPLSCSIGMSCLASLTLAFNSVCVVPSLVLVHLFHCLAVLVSKVHVPFGVVFSWTLHLHYEVLAVSFRRGLHFE